MPATESSLGAVAVTATEPVPNVDTGEGFLADPGSPVGREGAPSSDGEYLLEKKAIVAKSAIAKRRADTSRKNCMPLPSRSVADRHYYQRRGLIVKQDR